jgi:hypothetical protein
VSIAYGEDTDSKIRTMNRKGTHGRSELLDDLHNRRHGETSHLRESESSIGVDSGGALVLRECKAVSSGA